MKCQKCNKRKATEIWIGEGDVLSYVHGAYEHWCLVCVSRAQLKYMFKHIFRFVGCFIIFLFWVIIMLLAFLGFSNGG